MIGISDYHKKFKLIRIVNNNGFEITLCDCGAGIKSIKLDNKELTLSPYLKDEYLDNYPGKTIGRSAGRIENANFRLNGRVAKLDKNNFGYDNLHGGASGFHNKKFDFDIIENEEYTDVIFTCSSPDGDGGYIGNVDIKATYRVYMNENDFNIIFDGTTDDVAMLNMTNHVYFNLNGDLKDLILDNTLYLNSSRVGKLNERLIIENIISDYRFDFRSTMKIGTYMEDEVVQRYTLGYDHPFMLDEVGLDKLAARLYSEEAKLALEIRTTYPWVVVYTDNQANPTQLVGKDTLDRKYLGICLECQYNPNGINTEEHFGGILTKDKPYHEEVHYSFKRS